MLRTFLALLVSITALGIAGLGKPLPVQEVQLLFRHEGRDYAIRYLGVIVQGEKIASAVFIIPEEAAESYSLSLKIEKKCVALEKRKSQSVVSEAKTGLYFVSARSEVHCLSEQFVVPEPEVIMRGDWQDDIKSRFIEFLATRQEPIKRPEPMAVLRTAMAHH